jgi:dTDP-4-amino-4,6-dideoxygalactose transaminase
MLEPGVKANLSDVHAALGLSQLTRLDANLSERRRLWSLYTEGLAGLPLDLPALPPADHGIHAMHLYTVLIRLEQVAVDRDEILASLRAENIGCGVHYPALHVQPYFSRLGMRPEDLPGARRVSERTLSLPFSPTLTDTDARDVIAAVNKVLLHYGT